jgi:hypothetical protein
VFYRTLKYNKILPSVQCIAAITAHREQAKILLKIKNLLKQLSLARETTANTGLQHSKDCI